MAAISRPILHQYFRAECGNCGFAVHAEVRNGSGGWNECSWDDFSRQCQYRTAAGKQTLVCPHLRAAKLKAQPVVSNDIIPCGTANPCGSPTPPQLRVVAGTDESRNADATPALAM
jgi:hypothetical protein